MESPPSARNQGKSPNKKVTVRKPPVEGKPPPGQEKKGRGRILTPKPHAPRAKCRREGRAKNKEEGQSGFPESRTPGCGQNEGGRERGRKKEKRNPRDEAYSPTRGGKSTKNGETVLHIASPGTEGKDLRICVLVISAKNKPTYPPPPRPVFRRKKRGGITRQERRTKYIKKHSPSERE